MLPAASAVSGEFTPSDSELQVQFLKGTRSTSEFIILNIELVHSSFFLVLLWSRKATVFYRTGESDCFKSFTVETEVPEVSRDREIQAEVKARYSRLQWSFYLSWDVKHQIMLKKWRPGLFSSLFLLNFFTHFSCRATPESRKHREHSQQGRQFLSLTLNGTILGIWTDTGWAVLAASPFTPSTSALMNISDLDAAPPDLVHVCDKNTLERSCRVGRRRRLCGSQHLN